MTTKALFTIQSIDDIPAVTEYLTQIYNSTVVNRNLIEANAGILADQYQTIGELRIKMEIEHVI
jgi:hypothetical protein